MTVRRSWKASPGHTRRRATDSGAQDGRGPEQGTLRSGALVPQGDAIGHSTVSKFRRRSCRLPPYRESFVISLISPIPLYSMILAGVAEESGNVGRKARRVAAPIDHHGNYQVFVRKDN